ncbi:MAG TPA: hypothetical protein VKB58_05190, partial [Terriglobales bacterium]|nr:hypothetical protein [Terriglobales bacterium]
ATVDSLAAKYGELVTSLAKTTGIDAEQIRRQTFLTPSCGTGSLPVADAELVFKTLFELSSRMQKEIGAPALAAKA